MAVYPPSGDTAEDVVVDTGVDEVFLQDVLHLVEVEVIAELREDADVDLLERDERVLFKNVHGDVQVVLEARVLAEHGKGDRLLRDIHL